MNIPMLLPFLQSLTEKWTGGLRVVNRDRHGHEPDYSGYGQTIVGQRRDQILVKFIYGNSTEDVVVTSTGTGADSNSNSRGVVSSGAGVGSCIMRSKRFINYRPAHDIHSVLSAYFPSTNIDANTYQYAGLRTAEDRLMFGRSGTTFGILYRNNSTDEFVAQSAWNVDKCDGTGISKFTLDPTKLNQYRFMFGWLGVAPIICQVYSGYRDGWITCHVFDGTNTTDAVSFSNPSFNIAIEAGRTAGAGAVTVGSGSWNAGYTAGVHSHAGHRIFAGELPTKTLVAGVETYLGTFENVSIFQGKPNTVQAEAVFLSFVTDGVKSVTFRGYSNATLSTSYNAVPVSTANSIIAADTSSTSFSGGKLEFPISLAKVDSRAIDVGAGHFHLELQPGEKFTITAQSANASDVSMSARWEEYFS